MRPIAGGKDDVGTPRPVVIVQDDRFDATPSVTVCAVTTNGCTAVPSCGGAERVQRLAPAMPAECAENPRLKSPVQLVRRAALPA